MYKLKLLGKRNVAVVFLIASMLVLSACSMAQPTPTPEPPTLDAVETFTDLDATHVPGPVSYAQTPPVGGQHNPVWLNCGIYAEAVPSEQAVHSMEHGAVWITYQPDLSEADVTKLREQVSGNGYVLLSPFPDLPEPVVASAWGVQLKLTGADDARLPLFIAQYANGPQTPEPGAPCSSGVGEPIG